MNFKRILYVMGYVLVFTGAFMLLPVIVGLVYGEYHTALVFLLCALVFGAAGFGLTRLKAKFNVFTVRDGYVAVALSWIVMSAAGALPFTLSGEIPFYLDALFETISGFTTTGASILEDIEGLTHAALFWRSFTHWIGGMGILVFILTILPTASEGSSFSLMQAESPGPVVSKLVPRLRASAQSLYAIYIGLTALEFIFLALGGMPVFDNFCITFGTMGTGGFAPLSSSCASYSPYLQWVITVFMLLAGTNFGLYFLILHREWRSAGMMEEVRYYFIIVAAAAALISWNLMQSGQFTSLREVLFQVASIMTTTGFATTDFDLWPMFSHGVLILLMLIGACAGSTGGGMKVSRLILYCKSAVQEVRTLTKPRAVRVLRMDGKRVEESVLKGALLYLVCYVGIMAVSVLIILLENLDFETSFTAVAATLNNIGPGFSQVGASCNYAFFSPLSKVVLCFDMLAGRLEIFPILILFSRRTWQRNG